MTLLDVAGLRLHIVTSLEDDALQLLLDDAEQAIDALYGPIDDGYGIEETIDGGGSYIFLRRRASSIALITETDGDTETELEADDYRLRGDGVSVLRLATGTNPRVYWGAPVVVASSPLDDEAQRKRVQIELIKLELGFAPGNSTSKQIGSWSEGAISSASFDYGEERAKILNSLFYVPAPGFA